MEDFRMRQVHLDFHTSPAIDGIGEKFDKKEWQETLKTGRVNSITVFSKCHHGYSYHPSEVNEMHPGLKFDLLGAQLEACREIGVKAPVYISAGLDEKDAVTHPEWLARNENGAPSSGDFMNARFHLLCLNTAYLDKLIAEIEEVMQKYKPCGIFLDILDERICYCAKCRADMTAAGLDFTNPEDASEFGKKVYKNYRDRVEQAVRKYDKNCTIFHNSGHVQKGRRDLISSMSHLELESLPTGGWGYDHFPMSAAYARTVREHFLGMTGKFHKSWGEFGGFKHPNALRYEAALSLAVGAGCSVGDQMHPNGKLNPSTFRLIGAAYSELEKKEPWCVGAKNISEIAVLSTESIPGQRRREYGKADTGANRILLETGRLYDYIDTEADFNAYKLLIIPDYRRNDEGLKEKINAYLACGGKLLISGTAGTDDSGFMFDTGAEFIGENEFRPTYFVPCFDTVNGYTEYIMRAESYRIKNINAEIISKGKNPYFNRNAMHFCSHQHAPDNDEAPYETAVIKNNVAYIGWNIFTGYAVYGDLHIKELVNEVIKRLMDNDFLVGSSKLDRGIITLQQKENKKLVHLLFAHTSKRGDDTEVIEDIVPLYNVDVNVKTEKPEKVILVPQNEEIKFNFENGRVYFTVPKVEIHQMISIE
ncbi:MAG: alpha-L-fucosidase [Clostridia bacterium]|nr:alpha-L-fucosidase [Clostridia bacterium]